MTWPALCVKVSGGGRCGRVVDVRGEIVCSVHRAMAEREEIALDLGDHAAAVIFAPDSAAQGRLDRIVEAATRTPGSTIVVQAR